MGKKAKKANKPISVVNVVTSATEVKKGFSLIWLGLLLAATLFFYLPTLENSFTNWDDELYVVQNPILINHDLSKILTQPVVGNYHPLTMLSLYFNYANWGLSPVSYFALNIMLHLINVGLVMLLIFRLSKDRWVALITAAIFALHPMHVESVAWISERKDVLYTSFFIGSMLLYLTYLERKTKTLIIATFILFLCSLLSKPAAVIFPLVMLLIDYWKVGFVKVHQLVQKIPFFALSVIFGILTLNIQSEDAVAGLDRFSIADRLIFASYAYSAYFAMFFYPSPLSAYHPYPLANSLPSSYFIYLLLFIVLCLIIYLSRKHKLIFFGLCFYVLNLLLVSQLISVGSTIISERYTYVPYIGLAFALCVGINEFVRMSSIVKWSLSLPLVLGLGYLCQNRATVWRDSNTLWSDVISKYPQAAEPYVYRAHYNYRMSIDPANNGRADSLLSLVINDCSKAISINPNLLAAYEDRGIAFLMKNLDNKALEDGQKLLSLNQGHLLGLKISGTAYYKLGQHDAALKAFNDILNKEPNDEFALAKRASIFMNRSKYEEALKDFSLLSQTYQNSQYYMNSSLCLYQLGKIELARNYAQKAASMGYTVDASYKQKIGL